MSLLTASSARRQAWADEQLDRLTPIMSALSVVFLLVVLAEQFARSGSALAAALVIVGWALWFVFAAEFVARLLVAPDRRSFLRRNWWQVVFLLLPFLRVLRLARALKFLRTGRVLSSAVRSTRTARHLLGSRISWLAVTTAITILSSSQLLYAYGGFSTYGSALHAAALATVAGEPFGLDDPFSRTLEVVLAVYSVVVFATLAGSIGAYFLERRDEPPTSDGGATRIDVVP